MCALERLCVHFMFLQPYNSLTYLVIVCSSHCLQYKMKPCKMSCLLTCFCWSDPALGYIPLTLFCTSKTWKITKPFNILCFVAQQQQKDTHFCWCLLCNSGGKGASKHRTQRKACSRCIDIMWNDILHTTIKSLSTNKIWFMPHHHQQLGTTSAKMKIQCCVNVNKCRCFLAIHFTVA